MNNLYFEISGYGQTNFGELYDYSLEDLIFESTNIALDNAKTNLDEIDAVFIGNMIGGEVAMQSHLGAVFSQLYNFNKPVIRVEGACASGGLAVYTAIQGLKAKSYKKVLVIGAEKMTDFDSFKIGEFLMQAASPEERDAGLSFPALYALMAQSYMNEFGLSRDELSMAPVLMHKNALNNPKAQFKKEFTIEQINKSSKIAEPLRLLDCSPISDGAAAIIISATENLDSSKAYLVDCEVATDAIGLSQRENYYSIKSAKIASKNLYEKYNINIKDIGVLELHDCFSIALFIALEDLGFAKVGEAKTILSNILNGSSDLILNPSGGLKACGHPVGATGIKQIIEVAKSITEKNLNLGLAHNIGGSGGTAVISLLANKHYLEQKI